MSTKNLKGIAEVSINIALVVCATYTAYSFLYKGSFIENMISEALTVTEALKASFPKDSLGSLPKIENLQQTLLDFQLKSLPNVLKVCFVSTIQAWVGLQRRFHLSEAHIQMAKELGMNPKKLGKIANHKQEPWKMPLSDFIKHLHEKKFLKRSET